MIASVLYGPDDAHRDAVLGDGPCGARVPHAGRHITPDYALGPWVFGEDGTPRTNALVLAHDGRPVPEGMDRLARVLAEHLGYDASEGVRWIRGAVLDDAAMWTMDTGLARTTLPAWPRFGSRARPLRGQRSVEYVVPALMAARTLPKPLRGPWALAVVVADRLGGSVVLLDENGKEVTP